MSSLNKNNQIHIGTSGWHYSHWIGPFYPPEISSQDLFDFYQKYFDTVEINSTFYKLPSQKTLKDWKDKAGKDFTFSLKASKYITHLKKMKEPRESIVKFFDRIEVVQNNLGPILFQLPPKWKANPERLDNFIVSLPLGFRYAFEFRDDSWFIKEIRQILEKHNCALCIYDFNEVPSQEWITTDLVYLRLHGPEGKYQGSYSKEVLSQWARKIQNWRQEGREVFLYFDNDQEGCAPDNALNLKEKLDLSGE